MRLSGFIQEKDNNFNLIRFIAASAVLLGHSFALLNRPEPLGKTLGISIGSIAVDLFFITSGFLVAGSLLSKQSAMDYIWARILRIYPALIVMCLLVVFGLGIFFTSLPANAYLNRPATYAYLGRCMTLLGGVAYYLPGVFSDNPYKGAVNGSLWSMVYEIKMYILLLLFWLVCSIGHAKNGNRVKRTSLLVVANTVFAYILTIARRLYGLEEDLFIHFDFMFFTGATYWVLRERILLSLNIFLAVIGTLLASVLISTQAFSVVYQLSIAYVLFYLAYVPAGFVRKYNALPDNSYGIYIYAFPVQQSLIALFPGISVSALTAASFGITLCFAYASCYLIEQPALKLKKIFGKRTIVTTPSPAAT
ncbi:acyltransferase family protein [Undibacterium terreum]|uniref:Acyltransferase n=1 Tax=Undibacterium terreum TaxID=1224302 RepID=A0A916UQI9_9BURK|nr:acyltransferase [Undibacterium terreum]GGC82975.1 acyltransferase [Undibacterium terreum]